MIHTYSSFVRMFMWVQSKQSFVNRELRGYSPGGMLEGCWFLDTMPRNRYPTCNTEICLFPDSLEESVTIHVIDKRLYTKNKLGECASTVFGWNENTKAGGKECGNEEDTWGRMIRVNENLGNKREAKKRYGHWISHQWNGCESQENTMTKIYT